MADTGVSGTLTDGTGVSPLTPQKLFKDFVADVLLSGAAALAAAQVLDVGSAIQAPEAATFALIGAVIRAGYRAALRWAQSPG
jgi:phosphate/sulfate permease